MSDDSDLFCSADEGNTNAELEEKPLEVKPQDIVQPKVKAPKKVKKKVKSGTELGDAPKVTKPKKGRKKKAPNTDEGLSGTKFEYMDRPSNKPENAHIDDTKLESKTDDFSPDHAEQLAEEPQSNSPPKPGSPISTADTFASAVQSHPTSSQACETNSTTESRDINSNENDSLGQEQANGYTTLSDQPQQADPPPTTESPHPPESTQTDDNRGDWDQPWGHESAAVGGNGSQSSGKGTLEATLASLPDWSSEILSSATGLMRSHLGGFAEALKSSLPEVNSVEAGQRRQRRKLDEAQEQKALADAWSSAWNASWTGFDEPEEEENEDFDDSLVVESGAGVRSEQKKPTRLAEPPQQQSGSFWDWTGVSSIAQQLTSSVQDRGRELVEGSIGVLETIGAKTMSVLQDNDPGFKYTKQFFRVTQLHDRPNLSQLIREAHQSHSDRDSLLTTTDHRSSLASTTSHSKPSSRFLDFSSQLEQNRALIHLEALEMVGERADSELPVCIDLLTSADSSQVSVDQLTQRDGLLDSIWSALQPADDDEEQDDELTDDMDIMAGDKLDPEVEGLTNESEKRLFSFFQAARHKLDRVFSSQKLGEAVVGAWCLSDASDGKSKEDCFNSSVRSLVDTTTATLAYLHKLSELLLAGGKRRDCAQFVDIAQQVALLVRSIVHIETALCTRFMQLIKSAPADPSSSEDAKPTPVNQLVASLMLNCGNAQMYVKNSSTLLVPVVQLACANAAR